MHLVFLFIYRILNITDKKKLLASLPVLISILICSSCSKQTIAPSMEEKPKPQYGELLDQITFSGYTWNVKKPDGTVGPGPNYWSGKNVWVDENGWLHLTIRKKESSGKWECAEVYTTQKFGYGTYQWKVEGAISALDRNVVLGLFNYSGNNLFDEMDIEFARWGNNDWPNLNYTIYPETGQTAAKSKSYTKLVPLNNDKSTQRFKRTKNEVTLKSLEGFHDDDTGLFASKTFTKKEVPVSSLAMPVYINLWLFEGTAPSDSKTVEIIIKEFKFKSL